MNYSDITKAIQALLESDPGVQGFLNRPIERESVVNFDPNQTPWIGVYKGAVNYSPRTIGYNSFEAEVLPRIIVQAASLRDGDDCSTRLDEYVQLVLDAIRADRTLGGTVDMITGYNVEYGYTETERTSVAFQSAIITITAEVDDR